MAVSVLRKFADGFVQSHNGGLVFPIAPAIGFTQSLLFEP
jgi:hypothetical protein